MQALKNIGCAKVVYVTRRGEDSKFARGVAKLLGMPDDADKQLYDLDDPQSSFSRALSAADAVWCTDWDRFKDEEITAMADESYAAVLETKDAYFAQGASAYAHRSERTNFRGCSVGAPAAAGVP